MNLMQIVLNHWQAKIGSFFAACLLWLVLKEAIEPGSLDQLLTGTRVKTVPVEESK